jgi:hypothetical protein
MSKDSAAQPITPLDLFYTLYQQQASGILQIRTARQVLEFSFERGVIVNSSSNFIESLTLGSYLSRAGFISPSDIENAESVMIQTRQQMGRILLDANKISPHDLFEAIRTTTLQKIGYCLQWRLGVFTFEERPALSPEHKIIELDTLKVLFTIIKEIPDLTPIKENFRKVLYDNLTISHKKGLQISRLEFNTLETKLWQLCSKHPCSLPKLITMLTSDITQTVRSIYSLLALNIIEFEASPQSSEVFQKIQEISMARIRQGGEIYAAPIMYPLRPPEVVLPDPNEPLPPVEKPFVPALSDAFFSNWERPAEHRDFSWIQQWDDHQVKLAFPLQRIVVRNEAEFIDALKKYAFL